MKFLIRNSYILLILILLGACSSDDSVTKDEEKPVITINYDGGFPKACEQLKRGETYIFKAKATDNQALAAYSLNIHNNFDQHTHDDQEENCVLDDKKDADNPLLVNENYTIEGGPSSYELQIEMFIPTDVDTGDYHCTYSVIDETGWQAQTSIDIKIIE